MMWVLWPRDPVTMWFLLLFLWSTALGPHKETNLTCRRMTSQIKQKWSANRRGSCQAMRLSWIFKLSPTSSWMQAYVAAPVINPCLHTQACSQLLEDKHTHLVCSYLWDCVSTQFCFVLHWALFFFSGSLLHSEFPRLPFLHFRNSRHYTSSVGASHVSYL